MLGPSRAATHEDQFCPGSARPVEGQGTSLCLVFVDVHGRLAGWRTRMLSARQRRDDLEAGFDQALDRSDRVVEHGPFRLVEIEQERCANVATVGADRAGSRRYR